MDKYLREHYEDEITNLMNLPNNREHLSIHVDLCRLQLHDFDLFEAILYDAETECTKWDDALLAVQKFIAEEKDAFLEPDYQIKVNCHVRFVHLPKTDSRYKQSFPGYDQIDQFIEVKGNVVRMSQAKLLELKREYICSRCSKSQVIQGIYIQMYAFEMPKDCSVTNCKGKMYAKDDKPVPKYSIDYQEIKIQEPTGSSNMPKSLLVTLENDLVLTCQPGDCVTICGIIKRRWRSFQPDKPCILTLAMRAISLTNDQKRMTIDAKQMMEQMVLMRMEWCESIEQMGELSVRDLIVKSICPEVYGMYPVKLAIALVVCSGGLANTTTASPFGLSHRGQSHLLLVGDPGLAKSRLLLSAAAFAPRAVHTTGMGCSSAGLTAAAVKEDGEWQLEAGALVLADGGICCIDEFNLMRPTDRASIHEAMEQQTISMAKAGMVCKLSTRCAILAAANPKNLYSMSDPDGASSLNIGIASPLLSRFDLVYILRDERIVEWDSRIADHLLSISMNKPRSQRREPEEDQWTIEKLQSHFVAIRNVQPRMSDEANAMLGAYYRRCRNDPSRDLGRTTVRLLDSLTRLAKAHARLLFRDTVNASDAAIVIRLMESTYGFGRILKPFAVITEELPLGPDPGDVSELYRILDLGEYQANDIDCPGPQNATPPIEIAEDIDIEIETTEENGEMLQPQGSPNGNQDNLSEILSFDLDQSSNNTIDEHELIPQARNAENVTHTASAEPETTFSDDDIDVDDAILSQALDQIEHIVSNTPLLQQERESLQRTDSAHRQCLSSLALHQKKTFTLHNSQQVENSSRTLNVSSQSESNVKWPPKKSAFVRNRLLLTQIDDSNDTNNASSGNDDMTKQKASNDYITGAKRKIATQTIESLNQFQNPNIFAVNSKNESEPMNTEDSAYDTMNSIEIRVSDASEIGSLSQTIAARGKTAAFRKMDSESDEDLTCLDLDF